MMFSIACAHFRCSLRRRYDTIDDMHFGKCISAMKDYVLVGSNTASSTATIFTRCRLLEFTRGSCFPIRPVRDEKNEIP
ncbi:hypothetical protein Plhal304r1_c061g0148641 [Plasmopara halstedii]